MDLTKIEPSVKLGQNIQVLADDVELGSNVHIHDNVRIEAKHLVIGDNVHIDGGVTVRAKTFEIGHGSRIETRCLIEALGKNADLVRIGEQSFLGHDSKLLVPVAIIGDYVAVHNHTLFNGLKPLVIGHNCWIGQNCLINSNDYLTIGNNVGIGAYSSIYTHGFFGDLLEGCQVFKVAPVVLEDDACILGSYNNISPGVTVGAKSLVLSGSNVTKSIPTNHTFGGSPAKDMTDRLVPFQEIEPEEKFKNIRKFLREFVEVTFPGKFKESDKGFAVNAPFGRFRILLIPELNDTVHLTEDRPLLVFTKANRASSTLEGVTVFDLVQRQYTRTRSEAEICIIRFLKNPWARFIPADHPRVELPAAFKS